MASVAARNLPSPTHRLVFKLWSGVLQKSSRQQQNENFFSSFVGDRLHSEVCEHWLSLLGIQHPWSIGYLEIKTHTLTWWIVNYFYFVCIYKWRMYALLYALWPPSKVSLSPLTILHNNERETCNIKFRQDNYLCTLTSWLFSQSMGFLHWLLPPEDFNEDETKTRGGNLKAPS